jgi:hypothetical protein
MKDGADTINAAMKAMANVRKMNIDPKTGRVLNRTNKSILEDVYEKSGAAIPVEVKKIVEDKKETLSKTLNSTKDIVGSYYVMIQGKSKEELLTEENKIDEQRSPLDDNIIVEKLINEDDYMARMVKEINKKR